MLQHNKSGATGRVEVTTWGPLTGLPEVTLMHAADDKCNSALNVAGGSISLWIQSQDYL